MSAISPSLETLREQVPATAPHMRLTCASVTGGSGPPYRELERSGQLHTVGKMHIRCQLGAEQGREEGGGRRCERASRCGW